MPVLVAALLLPAAAGAQHRHGLPAPQAGPDSAAAAFIRQARAATRPYHSVDAAIAAGYRRIGPDMPNMGEHWVHPRLAVRGGLDPDLPSVLTYLPVEGRRVLTGVAYTVPVLPGESPPDPGFPGAAWHYHAGTVEEELAGGNEHAMHDTPSDDVRLAMMHAWIWTDNPDGVFTADNWALPFVRLGLPVPEGVPPEAAKALFLLEGGVDYYLYLIETVSRPGETERSAIHQTLAAYRGRVAEALSSSGQAAVPVDTLVALWDGLWSDVQRQAGKDLWQQIQGLAP